MFSVLKRLVRGFFASRPRAALAPRRSSGLGVERLDERSVPATLFDVAMLSARLEAPTVVRFDYRMSGDPAPFPVAVFRSADTVLDVSDVPIWAKEVRPTSAGDQSDRIVFESPMGIDPARRHVLVVADPGRGRAESNEANNVASFRKLAVAGLAHGFPLLPGPGRPAWVDEVGDALERKGYAATVRLDWVERVREMKSGQILVTAAELTTLLQQTAAAVATQPGDIVDIHVIGHSRGTGVASTTLQILEQIPVLDSLRLGYRKLTMLDPHVARNTGSLLVGLAGVRLQRGFSEIGQFSYDPLRPFSRFYAHSTLIFQEAAKDPIPVIPARTDEAEVFFQRLPWFRTVTVDRLVGLNFLSEPPQAIANFSGRPALFVDVGLYGIGHYGVPDFYRDTVALR